MTKEHSFLFLPSKRKRTIDLIAVYTVIHPSGVAHLGNESLTPLSCDFTTFWALLITLTQKTVLRGNIISGSLIPCGHFNVFLFPFCRKSRPGIFLETVYYYEYSWWLFICWHVFKNKRKKHTGHSSILESIPCTWVSQPQHRWHFEQTVCCWWEAVLCTVGCFSSIPGLYSLDAGSSSPISTTKSLRTLPKGPFEDKTAPSWKPLR